MSWPLWYLLALIVGVGIIYGLLRLRVSINWIVIIGILMAIIGVALDYCKENSIMQTIADLYFTYFTYYKYDKHKPKHGSTTD